MTLSASLPFPAELGAAGSFTRESLTGEKDPHGPYKDQAERAWEELLLRYWDEQAATIVARLKKLGVTPVEEAALRPGPTLFVKAASKTPIYDILARWTPAKIAALQPDAAKRLMKRLLAAGEQEGMTSPYSAAQVDAIEAEYVQTLLQNTWKQYAPHSAHLAAAGGPALAWYEKWKGAEPGFTPKIHAILRSSGWSDKQIDQLNAEGVYAALSGTIQPPKVAAPAEPDPGLLAVIRPQVEQDAVTAATVTGAEFEQLGVRLDWTLVNTEAVKWARKYSYELVKDIDKTTMKGLRAAIGGWLETPGATYGDLQGKLIDLAYPRRRARLIARTEVTRAYAMGSAQVAIQGEKWKTWPDLQPLFRYYKIWQTKNDHQVCPACFEMHNQEVEGVKTEFMTPGGPTAHPPLHPGCRCWDTYRPEPVTKEEAAEGYAAMKEKAKQTKLAKKQAQEAAKKLAAEKAKQEAAAAAAKQKAEAAAAKQKAKAEADKKHALDMMLGQVDEKTKFSEIEKIAHQIADLNDNVNVGDLISAAAQKQQQLAAATAAAKQKAEAAAAKKKAEAEAKQKAEAAKLVPGHPTDWRPGDDFMEPTASHAVWKKSPKTDAVKFTEKAPRYTTRMHLNGRYFSQVDPSPDFWESVEDKPIKEPPIPATGRMSTGVIMVEPDGRIWVVEPRDHYGGYRYTYPKGGMRSTGLTAQQNALKEVWEESGLLADIDDFLGDYVSEHTGNTTRYYVGRRVGGAPWAFEKESQAVYLMPIGRAHEFVHTERDLQVLDALRQKLGAEAAKKVVQEAATIARTVTMPKVAMPKALPEGEFPDSPEGLQRVRSLGGTTGAELVKDPTTGRLYVMKRGASADHLRSEVTADTLYRRLGVKVPACRLYETSTGPVKLAEYIPDTKSLKDVLARGTAAEKRKVLAQLKKHFVVDAWLGNWDVNGTEDDNILIDRDGAAWRIDNGGALFYRAQGSLKGGRSGMEYDQWLSELWSMRTDSNRIAYRVFKGLDWAQVVEQMEWLGGIDEAQLLAGVTGRADLEATLRARLGTLRDLWQTNRRMLDDRWLADYMDGFSKASVELRQSGLLDKLPQQLKHRRGEHGWEIVDENGRPFDALRGPNSASTWVERYMSDHGGDPELIRQWASSQGGSSWRGTPVAVKYWLAEQRGGQWDNYYWGSDGLIGARSTYNGKVRKFGKATFDNTLQTWHAFNYEFYHNTPFPNSNLEEGYLMLMRTESNSVMHRARAKEGQVNWMKRGANESASIYKAVCVSGHEMTLQLVPHHRVFGSYFFSRPGGGGSMFYGDTENELLFMPEGLPFYYWGSTGSARLSTGLWSKRIIDQLRKEMFQ